MKVKMFQTSKLVFSHFPQGYQLILEDMLCNKVDPNTQVQSGQKFIHNNVIFLMQISSYLQLKIIKKIYLYL